MSDKRRCYAMPISYGVSVSDQTEGPCFRVSIQNDRMNRCRQVINMPIPTKVLIMASNSIKSFVFAMIAVLATFLSPVSVQAQNTNTTIQEGRGNINRTIQYGDNNDNATYQTGKININHTIQLGGNNRNQTGQFGRVNRNRTSQGRGFERAGFKSD